MTKTIIEGFRGTERTVIGALVTLSFALALMLALPSVASAAPANDNFADAETISGESVSVNATNVGATTEPGEPSPTTSSTSSVWYSWTAPHSGYVAMDTCTSSFDTVLGVYKGGALGSLTQVKSDDDACTSPNQSGSKLTFATEGTTYHIRVASFSSSAQGTFTLNVGYVATPHDNFANAEVINGDSVAVNGNNVGATTETGEPLSATNYSNSNSSVWYRWQAPTSGQVQMDTCASDFDTVLSVHTGSAVGSLTEAASDDQGCVGTGNPNTSKLTFSARAGASYFIRVASNDSSPQGNFTLNVNSVPPLNDNFSRARSLQVVDSTSVTGSNFGTTTETGEPDTRVSHSSVWYRWLALETGKVEMDTCASGFDTVLSVYTGSAVDSLTQRALDDQGCVGTGNPNTSKLTLNVTQGASYFIRVASWIADPQQGNFTLKLRYLPPANDNFASVETISGESASVNGTNVGGSTEGSSETAAGFSSVWYGWQAPANGQAQMDTCTSDFNTLLGVHTGSALGSLSQVTSDDNSCTSAEGNDNGSKLSFDVTKDTTYYIRVASSLSSDKGSFTLDLVLADNVAPETTITDGPNGLTNDDTPTFEFEGSDDNTALENLRFLYQVDGGAWTEASGTSVTLPSLPDGPHTFSVKAVDEAGNEDADPAEQSFTVEVGAPKVETVSPSESETGVSRMTNVTVTFSEPMKPNTIVTTPKDPANPNEGTSSTIKMKVGKKTVPLKVTLSPDGKTVTLDPFPTDPLRALAANKTYKVTITIAVKDLQGKALDQDPARSGNQPKVWTFTTGST